MGLGKLFTPEIICPKAQVLKQNSNTELSVLPGNNLHSPPLIDSNWMKVKFFMVFLFLKVNNKNSVFSRK